MVMARLVLGRATRTVNSVSGGAAGSEAASSARLLPTVPTNGVEVDWSSAPFWRTSQSTVVVPTGTLLTVAVNAPLAATPASISSGVPLRPSVGSLSRTVVSSSLTVLAFSSAAMRTWRVRSTTVV